MFLISNNCLSGHLYKDCFKKEYNNPFIWTVINFENMLKLIKNFDNINFNNYELIKDENWNFSIIIDNLVKINYVHCKFDPRFKKPTKIGPDIFYNEIWKYIVLKYEERLKRMKQLNEKPIFCICNFETIYPDCIYSDDELNILSKFENVKILTGQEHLDPLLAAENFYAKFFKN